MDGGRRKGEKQREHLLKCSAEVPFFMACRDQLFRLPGDNHLSRSPDTTVTTQSTNQCTGSDQGDEAAGTVDKERTHSDCYFWQRTSRISSVDDVFKEKQRPSTIYG